MVDRIIPAHVQANLDWLYGSKEYRIYLTQILSDSRDGQRRGFPKETASVLFALLQAHDEKFPQHIPPLKPWDIA